MVKNRTEVNSPGHVGHIAGHHDNGHGLANGPTHPQDNSRGHPAPGRRKGHPEHRFQVGGAQGQGGLLILLRDRSERGLGDTDDGGQDHNGQHHNRCQQAGAGGQTEGLLNPGHQHNHTNQAVNHRGNPRQQLHRRVNDRSHPGIGHLGQVNGCHQPNGDPDQHRSGGTVDGGEDKRQNPVRGVRGRGGPGLSQQEIRQANFLHRGHTRNNQVHTDDQHKAHCHNAAQ